MKREEFIIRDPFVLPDSRSGYYYLYGTTRRKEFYPQVGYYAFRSRDLEEWGEPFPVFLKDENFWATDDFWAPEVHLYKGRYYMFATMHSDTRLRGTQIFVADSPEGPFVPVSSGPVTPEEWYCLDGTLYVDESGKPWIVFCHEWVQIQNGSVEAMPLTEDLTAAAGKPVTLFHASDAPWVDTVNRKNHVTDGPFLFRRNGKLCMLWSSFGKEGYAMGIAESESLAVTGPWHQRKEPLFCKDGGHGMLFRKFDGTLMYSLHQPNAGPERPCFFPFPEKDAELCNQ